LIFEIKHIFIKMSLPKTNLYVLRLAMGKFYVGKSVNPEKRIHAHFTGKGAVWTRLYKPLAVEKVLYGVDPYEEDMLTKQIMAKAGIDNVRGGTYVQKTITEQQMKFIEREIWAAHDSCTRCGRNQHFAAVCHHTVDVNGHQINDFV
jgi:hypothetical protein